jgi:hypothetical protein
MKFLPNIKEILLYHWSSRMMAVVVLLQGAWGSMPAEWRTEYPTWVTPVMAYSTGAMVIRSTRFAIENN